MCFVYVLRGAERENKICTPRMYTDIILSMAKVRIVYYQLLLRLLLSEDDY